MASSQSFSLAFKSQSAMDNGCRLKAIKPLQDSLRSLYLLSSFFGHKNCFHYNKFSFGLGLWIANLIIHFSLDFYEAYAIFGPAWASGIGMYLITFVTASTCLVKVTFPWLENSLLVLHDDGRFPETLRIMKIVLKLAPIVVVCLGFTGGAGQYTCYYMDGAMRLNFNNVLPKWLEIVLNALRFTSLLHMFCGYSLFLAVLLCVMVVSQLSMKEFKVQMDKEFKKTPSNLSFGQAVALFEERCSFINESSKSCSIMMIILVMSSTLSFVLNSYNFLFVHRFAIYFWFAVLPLLWVAIPLAIAAWVTETYQSFAGVVLKNWAQISLNEGRNATENEGPVTRSLISREWSSCRTCRLMTPSKNARREKTGSQYAKRKFSKRVSNVIRPLRMNISQCSEPSSPGPPGAVRHGETNHITNEKTRNTVHCTLDQRNTMSRGRVETIWIQTQPIQDNPCVPTQRTTTAPQLRPELAEAHVTARAQSTLGRFDFERYMIYLQCLLPDVGFSIGGCLITWDKFFALGVFMASLSAVFIQEVLFGSRKNTLGRP